MHPTHFHFTGDCHDEAVQIIGGFFSLELPNKSEYHQQAVHLNSARYALEYVLRVRHYKKYIYLPIFATASCSRSNGWA
ncbi:hypothetical protein NBRC111894_3882 [Sporolactobacillus inulinus]|uniref:Uncharacterized protein n=1 Tax=Sporolactobacillus inulinus TaxID=2078 RepID=A0A4Y1ZIZ6_9BACL|nr:hypothetical protein [Sporolactobacillus inulinus]GAY78328.1 hypothetical protein NBRC111894_3882 [Sporolactobacillus inulinus]